MVIAVSFAGVVPAGMHSTETGVQKREGSPVVHYETRAFKCMYCIVVFVAFKNSTHFLWHILLTFGGVELHLGVTS